MCKFIGWFECASGFICLMGYLLHIVHLGFRMIKEDSVDLKLDHPQYYLAVSSVSAIVIEFHMMLGWYLLIGVYKEDVEKLKVWLRSTFALVICVFCVLGTWVFGLCNNHFHQISMMALITCHYALVSMFCIHSILVVNIYREQLLEAKASSERPETVEEVGNVPSIR